jgi:phage baseplate assembly protein W
MAATRNLRFPLQRSKTSGYFDLTVTSLEAVKQNLLLFFAVDEGERMVRNELGSRFRRYLFEPDTKNIRLKCESEVNRIFNNYFPQLNLDNLEIEVIENNATIQGTIKINISYSFKQFETVKDSLVVVLG